MWWLEHRPQLVRLIPLALVLAVASLAAGCFEPLYGTHTSVSGVPDSVHYRLAAVDGATARSRAIHVSALTRKRGMLPLGPLRVLRDGQGFAN
jgi:hypothetical protein